MTRSAVRWSAGAGVAWLLGSAQFVLIAAEAGLGLFWWLIGVAMYGAWALALGVLLLRRPTRRILAVSLAFALVSLVLNWTALPVPSLDGPYWLSWLPDAIAGTASLMGLLVSRKREVAISQD